MTREEAKQMFRDDKNSQGCYRSVMTKLNKIYDSLDEELERIKNLKIPDVSGSDLEADYWSERCKIVENIWDNTNVEYIDDELANSENEYHEFIKDNGGKHYR